MQMKLNVFLLLLCGAGLMVGACGSNGSVYNDNGDSDEREYIDDETLESFDRDLRSLALAISQSNEDVESALRTKISETARMYQRALISALYDNSSTPRRTLAAVMLGFTGDASVIDPLLDKVMDEDEPERVRLNAMLGLETLGDKLRDYDDHRKLIRAISFHMDSLEASHAMRRASILTFTAAYDGAQNDSILPLRNRFMSDPDLRVQIAAINAMGDIGDTIAVPDLVHIGLGHPEYKIRAASAVALGKIEDPARVLPALKKATEDETAVVRRQALDAISKHYGSDPEMVYATLITGLSDFDERAREAAASALARINDTRAIEPLLQATGDRTAVVRAAAARALGALIGEEREKEAYPLIALLADQNPGVKDAALDSLTRITTEDHGADQTTWRQYFWTKYPELDPKNMYGDGPKPRVTSGISNTRRSSSTPRRTNTRNTGNRTNRNTQRRR